MPIGKFDNAVINDQFNGRIFIISPKLILTILSFKVLVSSDRASDFETSKFKE